MITVEISEEDFKKLNLYGWKMQNNQPIKMSLNQAFDLEKKYCKECGFSKMAVLLTQKITDKDIENHLKALWNNPFYDKMSKETKERIAITNCIYDIGNFIKYYWQNPSTYNFWCGVKEIKETSKNISIIADTEDAIIPKTKIKKIYIVSL